MDSLSGWVWTLVQLFVGLWLLVMLFGGVVLTIEEQIRSRFGRGKWARVTRQK